MATASLWTRGAPRIFSIRFPAPKWKSIPPDRIKSCGPRTIWWSNDRTAELIPNSIWPSGVERVNSKRPNGDRTTLRFHRKSVFFGQDESGGRNLSVIYECLDGSNVH